MSSEVGKRNYNLTLVANTVTQIASANVSRTHFFIKNVSGSDLDISFENQYPFTQDTQYMDEKLTLADGESLVLTNKDPYDIRNYIVVYSLAGGDIQGEGTEMQVNS